MFLYACWYCGINLANNLPAHPDTNPNFKDPRFTAASGMCSRLCTNELMDDQLSASCWYFSLSISHALHQSDAAALQNTLSSPYPLTKTIPQFLRSAGEEVVRRSDCCAWWPLAKADWIPGFIIVNINYIFEGGSWKPVEFAVKFM